jgi:hypothetical protein
MPLTKCPACHKEISTQAASCPNCGHPLAKSAVNTPHNKVSFGRFIVLVLFLVGVMIYWNSGNNQTTAPTEHDDSCRADWQKCADNGQLVNHYSDWSHVQVECKNAANGQAKYGNPDWPWFPFGTFHAGNNYITSGIAIAVEPDAQFSNGFGGMVHSRVTCTYDLRAKRVTSVDISAK